MRNNKVKPNKLKLETPLFIRFNNKKVKSLAEIGKDIIAHFDKNSRVIRIEIWNGNPVLESFMQNFKKR